VIADTQSITRRAGARGAAGRRLRRAGTAGRRLAACRSAARGGRVLALTLAAAILLAVPAYLWASREWSPEGEAKLVFDRIHPSMVVIACPGGGGSGVMLSEDGLVITNQHVVDGASVMAVTASGWGPRGWFQDAYVDVKVVGLHPRYDIALLKISAPGVRFVPAKVRHAWDTVKTAERCYAIGSPGIGHRQALQNSITSGLVSAAERRIDGLAYIQTSAAVNPGNSGGALCDSSGRLIGIVTLKAMWAEGVGFAIPCAGIRLADFRPQ
jgi:serine protease Do